MTDVKSILLVGVGGQGTILASKILTQGLLDEGYDVKMSEIHGMSQRGGSVTTQVRYGSKVHSPIIGEGTADILVAFEEMEAYRFLPLLRPDGRVLVNNYRIPSAPILSGQQDYPEGLKEEIMQKADTTVIDAAGIAVRIGMPKAMNLVLLGALIRAMNLENIHWETILRGNVKPEFLERNLNALQAGIDTVERGRK